MPPAAQQSAAESLAGYERKTARRNGANLEGSVAADQEAVTVNIVSRIFAARGGIAHFGIARFERQSLATFLFPRYPTLVMVKK